MTEGIAYDHHWVPGPSKYQIKRTLTEPKTPFLSLFGKTQGREHPVDGTIKGKKPSSIGPGSYKLESGI